MLSLNTKFLEDHLTKKELKTLIKFIEDISNQVDNLEKIVEETENDNLNGFMNQTIKKIQKKVMKRKLKGVIPIIKKLIKSKGFVKRALLEGRDEEELIPYNFVKTESLFFQYLNSFKKSDRSKLFLLCIKFMLDYYHMIHSNLIEASSMIKFEKKENFEAKAKYFLDVYPTLSENIYQKMIKFFLNCEYIRKDKKLNDNRNTQYGSVFNNLKKEIEIKKYKYFIFDNAVLIRNAKNHGKKEFLFEQEKLRLWDKNGKEIILTKKMMEKELNKLISLCFNNNILLIFLEYLRTVFLEEGCFEHIIDNYEEMIDNIDDNKKIEEIFLRNTFMNDLNKELKNVMSLELR